MSLSKYSSSVVLVFLLLVFLISTVDAQDQETNIETRTGFEVGYKLNDQVKLSLSPELRYDRDLSLDKYLIDVGVSYTYTDMVTLGATYRFIGNLRDEKNTEYLNRIAIGATYEKSYDRLEPSFRLFYSNYADDGLTDKAYIRYRPTIKYDLPDCKITPVVAVEIFQQLNDYQLYKTRYTTGMNYKLFKKNYLGLRYKYDSFPNDNKNTHIISLTYKLKL